MQTNFNQPIIARPFEPDTLKNIYRTCFRPYSYEREPQKRHLLRIGSLITTKENVEVEIIGLHDGYVTVMTTRNNYKFDLGLNDINNVLLP